jgi:hypothetical protein
VKVEMKSRRRPSMKRLMKRMLVETP